MLIDLEKWQKSLKNRKDYYIILNIMGADKNER